MSADSPVSTGAGTDSSPIERSPLVRWRERPERVAWIIILISFAIFLLLVIGIPPALQALYHTAAVTQSVHFEPTVGTVLLYPPRSDVPIALTDRQDDITEGSRLVTTGTATQGVIGLPVDDQNSDIDLMGTVHIYPGTSLELVRIRRPFFSGSDRPYTVRLLLHEGRVRLFTQNPIQHPLEVQVETPHGEIYLVEGNYTFSVTAGQSEVSVTQGIARLFPHNQTPLDVHQGMRTWMSTDEPTLPPVSVERNLLRNGDFSDFNGPTPPGPPVPVNRQSSHGDFNGPTPQEWEIHTVPYVPAGIVEVVEQEGRRVVHFFYRGPDNIHTEIGIRQTVDEDVHGYDSLIVKLDVKLLWQTLAGAGEQSSEFPLRLELTYTDIYGKNLTWGHGFYNRDPKPGWPLSGGEKLDLFVWFTYESQNLMEVLADTRPAHINSIRLYASGWNYEVMADEVGLFVE